MTDLIFVQVTFSRLRASSYNFENKEKYNMNLRFPEVYQVKLEFVKSFLSEFYYYCSYMKMNCRHASLAHPVFQQCSINLQTVILNRIHKEVYSLSDLFSSKDGHGIDILWINDP